MKKALFTPEELEEMRRADAEIDREERRAVSRETRRKAGRRYYAAHREKVGEKSKAYYATHREKIREYQKEYRRRNAEKLAATQKARQAKYEATLPEAPRKALRLYRIEKLMSQRELGEELGVTQSCISSWERGIVPIQIHVIERRLPTLAEEIRRAEGGEESGR